MCTIAFGTLRQRSSLAERFDVSRNTIRRVYCFSALTVLEVQLKQLRDLYDFTERNNPDVITALLQALAENGNSSLYPSALSRRSQSKSSFHVFLLPLCVAACWGPCKHMYAIMLWYGDINAVEPSKDAPSGQLWPVSSLPAMQQHGATLPALSARHHLHNDPGRSIEPESMLSTNEQGRQCKAGSEAEARVSDEIVFFSATTRVEDIFAESGGGQSQGARLPPPSLLPGGWACLRLREARAAAAAQEAAGACWLPLRPTSRPRL